MLHTHGFTRRPRRPRANARDAWPGWPANPGAVRRHAFAGGVEPPSIVGCACLSGRETGAKCLKNRGLLRRPCNEACNQLQNGRPGVGRCPGWDRTRRGPAASRSVAPRAGVVAVWRLAGVGAPRSSCAPHTAGVSSRCRQCSRARARAAASPWPTGVSRGRSASDPTSTESRGVDQHAQTSDRATRTTGRARWSFAQSAGARCAGRLRRTFYQWHRSSDPTTTCRCPGHDQHDARRSSAAAADQW